MNRRDTDVPDNRLAEGCPTGRRGSGGDVGPIERIAKTLINTHYIANARNGGRNPDLRDEWDLHKQKHKDRVLAHHRAGRLVIWTADTNNPDYAKATGRNAERQVFFRGIDRINWMPGDGRVRLDLLGTDTVDMRVDGHDARVAVFRIRRV